MQYIWHFIIIFILINSLGHTVEVWTVQWPDSKNVSGSITFTSLYCAIYE